MHHIPLILGSLLGFVLSMFATGHIVANPPCGVTGSADAIVVMGARVTQNGPSAVLRARAEIGVDLWRKGVAPFLVGTGGLGPFPPTEAETIANVARDAGVTDSSLVIEPWSHSTEESAGFVASLAAQHGWRRIVVVSDRYHVLRAAWMYKDQGFDVQTACTDERAYRERDLAFQRIREIGGLAYYATLRGLYSAPELGEG